MTKRSLEKEEFIGNNLKVINSKNKSLVGIEGKVIDETRNTLLINTQKGEKILLKNDIDFEIIKENKKSLIIGKKIMKRPEDRLK